MTSLTVDKTSTLAARARRGDRRALALREHKRLLERYLDEVDRLEAMRALGAAPAEIGAQLRRKHQAGLKLTEQVGLLERLGVRQRPRQVEHGHWHEEVMIGDQLAFEESIREAENAREL